MFGGFSTFFSLRSKPTDGVEKGIKVGLHINEMDIMRNCRNLYWIFNHNLEVAIFLLFFFLYKFCGIAVDRRYASHCNSLLGPASRYAADLGNIAIPATHMTAHVVLLLVSHSILTYQFGERSAHADADAETILTYRCFAQLCKKIVCLGCVKHSLIQEL